MFSWEWLRGRDRNANKPSLVSHSYCFHIFRLLKSNINLNFKRVLQNLFAEHKQSSITFYLHKHVIHIFQEVLCTLHICLWGRWKSRTTGQGWDWIKVQTGLSQSISTAKVNLLALFSIKTHPQCFWLTLCITSSFWVWIRISHCTVDEPQRALKSPWAEDDKWGLACWQQDR